MLQMEAAWAAVHAESLSVLSRCSVTSVRLPCSLSVPSCKTSTDTFTFSNASFVSLIAAKIKNNAVTELQTTGISSGCTVNSFYQQGIIEAVDTSADWANLKGLSEASFAETFESNFQSDKQTRSSFLQYSRHPWWVKTRNTGVHCKTTLQNSGGQTTISRKVVFRVPIPIS